MYYENMMGYGGTGVLFFFGIIYLLVVTFLVLAIAALLKYINKK